MVFIKTFDDHIRYLEKVFARIKEFNLGVNPEKTILAVQELHLLGHVVTHQGRKPDPEKTAAIANWPALRSVTAVQSFMSTVGYY